MHYKYLNIILYSDVKDYPSTIFYIQMKNLMYKYLITLENFKFYFYKYDENIDEDYIIDEVTHMILIKGKESMIPGMLNKTLKTMEICKNMDYDYIVRSGISTIIDFEILDKKIYNSSQENKVGLCSFFESKSDILDFPTYWFSKLVLCLNKKNIFSLLDCKFPSDRLEDTEISLALRSINNIDGIIVDLDNKHIGTSIFNESYIIYRLKTTNRENDVLNMELLIDNIIYNKLNIFNIHKHKKICHISNINSNYIYCYGTDLLINSNIDILKNIKQKYILFCYSKIPLTDTIIQKLFSIENLCHIFTDNIENNVINSFISIVPPLLDIEDIDFLNKNMSLLSKNTLVTTDIKNIILNSKYHICNNIYDIWLCLYMKTIPITNIKNKITHYISQYFPIIYKKDLYDIDFNNINNVYDKLNIWNNQNILTLNYINSLLKL